MGTRAPSPWCARRAAGLAALVLAAALQSACAQTTTAEDDALPVAVVEMLCEQRLTGLTDGVALAVDCELLIEPKEPGTFRVLGRGRGGGADDAMLQVSVRWRDFVGVSLTSFGGRRTWPLPFSDDGEAQRGAPLTRHLQLDLEAPQAHVLARRVDVSLRLHPVDVLGEEYRSGGARLEFAPATLECLVRQPDGTLDELLAAPGPRNPEELFLRAAATPLEQREHVIELLVKSLSRLNGSEREAAFGGLYFLTGESHGRQVFAWEAWLAARQRAVGP